MTSEAAGGAAEVVIGVEAAEATEGVAGSIEAVTGAVTTGSGGAMVFWATTGAGWRAEAGAGAGLEAICC